MPSIFDVLLERAKADTDLLLKNDALGDSLAVPRAVDFLFRAPTAEKAEIVSGFINDNRYGVATATSLGEEHTVAVIVHMPITQHVLCSVSGLMACIAKIFGVDYDGWGSEIQAPRAHDEAGRR
jgi:hypothetical protein